MRTVNGIGFAECLDKLRSLRPKKEDKGDTGYWYYPIEAFLDALDTCIGSEHYSIAFSDPFFRVVKSGQEMLSIRCTLTIFDDEGVAVKRVDGFGDHEVMYAKEGGRADLGNFTSSTAAFAVKDACKYLGIFGYRTGDGAKDTKQGKKRNSNSSSSSGGGKKKTEETVNFAVTKQFYQYGENNGSAVWKLPVCLIEGGNKEAGKAGEVIFYHNQTEKQAERFNQLISFVEQSFKEKKGRVTCRLLVTPTGERDGLSQYVFKNFA